MAYIKDLIFAFREEGEEQPGQVVGPDIIGYINCALKALIVIFIIT
jgi:hypothetical protein